ncbi:MAG: DUF4440 domain-containing protein [Rickettsiales bacterium]
MSFLFNLLLVMPFSGFAFGKELREAPDISSALVDWKQAVEGKSVDKILSLYDKDAIMISTFVLQPMTKREELVGYYKKVIENPDVRVKIEDTHPRQFGDMAVNTGKYVLSYTQEGEEVVVPARFSFVYQLRDGKWIIVDHHSSAVPVAE